MSVLSQMIRDREPFKRAALWCLEKTPAASHQNLGKTPPAQTQLPLSFSRGSSLVVSPVAVADGLHLLSDQAGEQRPGPGAWQELFNQASEPNVDVVRMLVRVEYLLGDHAASHNLLQITQCSDALQSAEFSPGIVSWHTTQETLVIDHLQTTDAKIKLVVYATMKLNGGLALFFE